MTNIRTVTDINKNIPNLEEFTTKCIKVEKILKFLHWLAIPIFLSIIIIGLLWATSVVGNMILYALFASCFIYLCVYSYYDGKDNKLRRMIAKTISDATDDPVNDMFDHIKKEVDDMIDQLKLSEELNSIIKERLKRKLYNQL